MAEGPEAVVSNLLPFVSDITYGDTAFWLEVLRLAKGLPILECHLQQLFVSNLLPFVSNLLPFVGDIYLW